MYLTNQFNGPHRFKAPRAEVFLYENDVAQCVARIGGTGRKALGPLLEHYANVDPALKDRLDRAFADVHDQARFVVWSDLNLDGTPQANEVSTAALDQSQGKRQVGSVGFGPQLSIVSTGGFLTPPPRFTARGIPLWNLEEIEYFSAHTEHLSDVVQTRDGFFVFAGSHYGGPLRGFRGGKQRWLYHNQKGPGVPRVQRNGQLIAATKMLGPSFGLPNVDMELFAINGDKGSVYLLSSDGLYVTDLGGDVRATPMLRLQAAKPGMRIDGYSFNDEHFHPSITPLDDGLRGNSAAERTLNW